MEAVVRKLRKTKTGVVVSTKMDKTISVKVERRLMHPLYGKFVKRSKKFFAHDEENTCAMGRLGTHHGNPSAQQNEALAPGGSR